MVWEYFGVFVIGALVGLSEIIARYRDEPIRAIRSPYAWVYCAINGGASIFALIALVTFGWKGGSTDEETQLLRLLTAGLGAMAVFRTSLFQVRVGKSDIGVGPIAFLQIFLSAMDRGIDRRRAEERARNVLKIMEELPFDSIKAALPTLCLSLMQNLPAEDAMSIASSVKSITDSADLDANVKVLTLGLTLMNFVGEDVLEEAVKTLREQLDLDAVKPPPSA